MSVEARLEQRKKYFNTLYSVQADVERFAIQQCRVKIIPYVGNPYEVWHKENPFYTWVLQLWHDADLLSLAIHDNYLAEAKWQISLDDLRKALDKWHNHDS